ncbi:sugar/nucleoside kinase (ribokinase family) [Neolewinella xylanilytica]|uniref:Sugar/nucleoside kinase (Ribokinase family) n=1 Tax=Neolewinella xylanilytica TaxID=1514080 RepID=A0A2S6I8I0_9BACT|nr:PfkB family carbohydrate kinase [Neolewinella xylanilytica]PPK87788.1 sugar/nucleoside kinase (ribokinase family) [Neolewinella xylanilytica]
MSLLAVGTLAYDDVYTPYGEVKMIEAGSCTYIAMAATYFVQPVQVVSVIGGDYNDDFLADLQRRGSDLEGVEVIPEGKSFYWAGRYHDDMMGRDTLDTQLNVLADFDPKVPESYRKAPYVMLGNLTPAVQSRVLDQLTERPKLVALDTMNFWMDHALEDLMAVLKRIDVLIINDEEARQLSGELSLLKAAAKIVEMGPKILIIKKGEHGALLFEGENLFSAPALLLPKVVDPTGAGDTFAGGLIGYLAATDDLSFANLKRAVIYGSAMASFVVEDFGTRRMQTLDQEQIDRRVQRFGELMTVSL